MAKPKTSGRPSKYNVKYNEQARKLCLMGYTDKQLGKFFEVAESTINKWKIDHKGFSESLKAGKEIADAEVTASLFERAKGYSHIETKVFNNQGEILTHDVNKIYPPDPMAIKYWLNNRQPTRWREKVEEASSDGEGQIQKIQIEVVGANGNN
jgi:hypothetical protein